MSWMLCLVGGMEANKTPNMLRDLALFILDEQWESRECRRESPPDLPYALPDPTLDGQRRYSVYHELRPPEGECKACIVLKDVSHRLTHHNWPAEVPGVLKAMPVDQWDLPGLLYLVGAMNDKVSIDSVADQMVVVLFHLYPKWVELRPVYWDTWKQT